MGKVQQIVMFSRLGVQQFTRTRNTEIMSRSDHTDVHMHLTGGNQV